MAGSWGPAWQLRGQVCGEGMDTPGWVEPSAAAGVTACVRAPSAPPAGLHTLAQGRLDEVEGAGMRVQGLAPCAHRKRGRPDGFGRNPVSAAAAGTSPWLCAPSLLPAVPPRSFLRPPYFRGVVVTDPQPPRPALPPGVPQVPHPASMRTRLVLMRAQGPCTPPLSPHPLLPPRAPHLHRTDSRHTPLLMSSEWGTASSIPNNSVPEGGHGL